MGVWGQSPQERGGGTLRSRQSRNVRPRGEASPRFIHLNIVGFRAAKAHTVIAPPARAAKTPNDLWEEYRALGFLRNVHPLALWKNEALEITNRVKAIRLGGVYRP
jgi:hypothetical protein